MQANKQTRKVENKHRKKYLSNKQLNYYQLCACMSVCKHISGITRLLFAKFLRMLPTPIARSSSTRAVICHVLPVVWMTSCLHIVGHM